MPSFSRSSTLHWLLSLKVVLISTGVLSMAVALKLTVPLVSDFFVSEGPSIWTFMLTCLRPPYLYILMNCIIISIVASSRLHRHKLDHTHSPDDTVILPSIQSPAMEPVEISGDLQAEYVVYNGPDTGVLTPVQSLTPEPVVISGDVRAESAIYDGVVSNGYVYDANVPAKVPVVREENNPNTQKKLNNEEIMKGSDKAPSSVRSSLQRKDSLDLSFPNENEKPPASARFNLRKSVKASPDGGKAALGVTKPKRQDTLESTWKTITEGRAMPLTRHLKKSDTWDSQLRRNAPLTDQNGTPPNPKSMKKSETVNERSKTCRENSSPSPAAGLGKLRKEPSLSQDDLNRRVEAFINKFNEEMRLQRQESLRQYREMISRGAY